MDRHGDEGRVVPVYAVPPWIGNPSWGSKTDQAGLPPDGKFLTLAECKTEDESTQVMTVTVQGSTLVKAAGSLNFGGPVAARVEFGTAGGVFTILVDVYKGIQFSIAASWIRVSVFNEAIFNPATSSQTPVQASASISMLPTTKNQTVTKTVLAVNDGAGGIHSLIDTSVAPGAFIVIPIQEYATPISPEGLFFCIPLFSKSLLVHSSSSIAAGISTPGARTIEFFANGGVSIAAYPFISGEKQFDPIPIPSATNYISIKSNENARTQTLIPQFFLDA